MKKTVHSPDKQGHKHTI